MTLLLVTATWAEMRAALGKRLPQGMPPLRRGRARACLAGREALLLVTGVGPLNAALEVGAALEAARAEGLELSGALCLGVAGSFDSARAPLGSAVLADAELYPDYGVAGPGQLADANDFGFAQWEGPSGRVFQRLGLVPGEAARAMDLALPDNWPRGLFVTSAAVTASAVRAEALAARHGALAENMEGFALALACLARGLPFLEVRTISNAIGERDRANWKLHEALAGLEAALDALLGS
ncbi:Futalosine hydrolase [Fundidesulfovibrio magnetotacticus]|uniref:Futalosine hydrolase n=1 Tax=Fundidesulfovibrio magnetotacticus TaxID=2730080 RepID=A0A6V8LQI3_9BACT|nr:futalosine hydrolase [Fundidesulfovibrio magnetotacticus]GFK92389.1 Futalosine hydrolase [Fundidesulfovibrio magnetotacticus]